MNVLEQCANSRPVYHHQDFNELNLTGKEESKKREFRIGGEEKGGELRIGGREKVEKERVWNGWGKESGKGESFELVGRKKRKKGEEEWKGSRKKSGENEEEGRERWEGGVGERKERMGREEEGM